MGAGIDNIVAFMAIVNIKPVLGIFALETTAAFQGNVQDKIMYLDFAKLDHDYLYEPLIFMIMRTILKFFLKKNDFEVHQRKNFEMKIVIDFFRCFLEKFLF